MDFELAYAYGSRNGTFSATIEGLLTWQPRIGRSFIKMKTAWGPTPKFPHDGVRPAQPRERAVEAVAVDDEEARLSHSRIDTH